MPGRALAESARELDAVRRQVLLDTMVIAAQHEMMVMPWEYTAFETAPDLGAKLAIAASIQDELGHSNQWGLIIEDLGEDPMTRLFAIESSQFRAVYATTFPIRDYIEFCMVQCVTDRAGRLWTLDYEKHCSYAPVRRVAKKVNFEQAFHVQHGSRWVAYYAQASEESRRQVEEHFAWLFPHGQMWFGAPDSLKSRRGQLDSAVRGWSNDDMRQRWYDSIMPWAERELGLALPARQDTGSGQWLPANPYPMLCRDESMTWTDEQCEWRDLFAQWRRGGPLKEHYLNQIRSEAWSDELWEDS